MPAVNYLTLNDICENLKYQIGDVVGLELVVAAITSLEVLNPGWEVATLTTDDRNNMLRKLTGCTVGIGEGVNCYPRGYVDTILFDLDGHELP
jgi:hypothetical protein